MTKKISKDDVQQALEIAKERLNNEVPEKLLVSTNDEQKIPEGRLHDEKKLLVCINEEQKIPEGRVDEEKKLLGSLNEEQKIPDGRLDEENELLVSANKENKFSLDNLLTNVLKKVEIPVSVSFINLFLSQKKVEQITEGFLTCKEIQDKFSIFLLGCDLKIQLKEHDHKADVSKYEYELLEIIQKDINKLRDLKNKLDKKKLTEVVYTDFIKNYSSHKYKMRLPFIVRNSHALTICKKAGNTYIRFISEDEQFVRDWDFQKGFEILLLECSKELLSNFTTPLDQGILQTCFNLGHLVIDKKFLNKYHQVFDGFGADGVTLKCIGKSNHNSVDLKSQNAKDIKKNENTASTTHRNFISKIEVAFEAKRSIIIVGSTNETPIFYYHESKCSDKVAALVKLKERIVSEIDRIN